MRTVSSVIYAGTFQHPKHAIRFAFYLILVSTVLLMVAAGCGDGRNDADDRLLYWSANNPYEIEFAEYVVNKWNIANPERRIKHQPVPEGRSSEEFILAAVVGKTTPDFYSNMWQGDVEGYARAGVLIPLDTLAGFNEFIYERCDSSVIREVTSRDGHIYQIPWKINPIMMLYNVRQFAAVGFEEPPETYSEYLTAARRHCVDSDGDGSMDRWIGYSSILVTWLQRFFDFYPLYLGASGGGKLVDNGKVAFNNEYAVQTFEFLQTLYDRGYFSRELLSARQDVFLSGFIATRFTGPWEIVHAEKFKPPGFEYDFSRLPVPDEHQGPVYTYGDPKNIVLFDTCRDLQTAWDFIRFMISAESDLKLLEITTQLPRRRRLFEDEFFADYFTSNPKMIPFARQAQFVRGTDASPVLKEVFDIISQEYEACVIYGAKSPRQAVNDAAEAAQLILD